MFIKRIDRGETLSALHGNKISTIEFVAGPFWKREKKSQPNRCCEHYHRFNNTVFCL